MLGPLNLSSRSAELFDHCSSACRAGRPRCTTSSRDPPALQWTHCRFRTRQYSLPYTAMNIKSSADKYLASVGQADRRCTDGRGMRSSQWTFAHRHGVPSTLFTLPCHCKLHNSLPLPRLGLDFQVGGKAGCVLDGNFTYQPRLYGCLDTLLYHLPCCQTLLLGLLARRRSDGIRPVSFLNLLNWYTAPSRYHDGYKVQPSFLLLLTSCHSLITLTTPSSLQSKQLKINISLRVRTSNRSDRSTKTTQYAFFGYQDLLCLLLLPLWRWPNKPRQPLLQSFVPILRAQTLQRLQS